MIYGKKTAWGVIKRVKYPDNLQSQNYSLFGTNISMILCHRAIAIVKSGLLWNLLAITAPNITNIAENDMNQMSQGPTNYNTWFLASTVWYTWYLYLSICFTDRWIFTKMNQKQIIHILNNCHVILLKS